MLAFGSALGGFAAARLGLPACFLIDASTYVASAFFTSLLLFMPNRGAAQHAAAAAEEAEEAAEGTPVTTELKSLLGSPATSSDAVVEAAEDERPPSAASDSLGPEEKGAGPSPRCRGSGAAREGGREEAKGESGFTSIVEGYKYIFARENREVLAYISIKGTGGLVWGAADVINVRLSADPRMQWLGGSEATLGYIFSAVGVGCIGAPFVVSPLVPQHELPLVLVVAVGFALLPAGYAIIAFSPNILVVLLGTVLRSAGSSMLWVFSTLLAQLRGKGCFLGRIFALEFTLFTLGQTTGYYIANVLLDGCGLSPRASCLPLTLMGFAPTAMWAFYWARLRASAPRSLAHTDDELQQLHVSSAN